MAKTGYVYILASKRRGTLYIGVTTDLIKRIFQHRNDVVRSFTSDYQVKRLVYFEQCEDILSAIQREKSLKRWRRAWKIELIEGLNPAWKDLYRDLL